jgi:predicted nucleic acid-binding protein
VRVLDTDVLIDIQRGHQPAISWFHGLQERPAVPALVVLELLQGAPNRAAANAVLALVAPLVIVYTTPSDQERALRDFVDYRLTHGLGLLDALIGATAVGLSASLCTFNVKHFQAIPRLLLEQPYRR